MLIVKLLFVKLLWLLSAFSEGKILDNGLTDIPNFMKICRRSDPNLNVCIKESVESMKPFLIKGIPELNIPSCEPLRIQEVIIDEGIGSVSLKSTYRDIQVYGPSNFSLENINVDLEKNLIRIKLRIPTLRMTGRYTMEGKILMLPISGSGLCQGNYSDIQASVTMQGQPIKKNGEIYYNVKDFYVDFNIGHAVIQLDNLFNGDKELGDSMNSFLNENWVNIAGEMKPVLEETVAGIFKKFANRIYEKYPLNVLLPP